MPYDSVHQLKNLVKKYYIRKGQMTETLLKKLDAIVVERPKNLEKRIEYFLDPSKPVQTQIKEENHLVEESPSYIGIENLSLSDDDLESDDSPSNSPRLKLGRA